VIAGLHRFLVPSLTKTHVPQPMDEQDLLRAMERAPGQKAEERLPGHMAQRGWWGVLDATALATLLACLIALLVGILLAFLAFAVEKATSHSRCTADGRS